MFTPKESVRQGPILAAVVALLLLGGTGLVVNKLWNKSLTEEASKTQAALVAVAQFKNIAESEIANAKIQRAAALASERRAAALEAAAAALADVADSIAGWAPDTCRPYLVAQVDARNALQKALDSQKQATAGLRAAATSDSIAIGALLTGIGTATNAAQDLVNATHRSFFAGLLPKPGLSVTAGITPRGKFDVVAGPSLTWTF